MWTDSKTTLAWIQSQHRRYRQFVAFRVGEILSKTESYEWKYVPTQHNPADDATKWGKGPSTDVTSRWFLGPEFLYQPEAEWPEQRSTESLNTEEELRACLTHQQRQVEDVYQINKFSKWNHLLRTAAYVHRYIDNHHHHHHHLTKLIIDWYHCRYLHANHATVQNEVRQRFHVSNLRTLIRRVSKDCYSCKITKAIPVTPRMAPLPDSRLAAMIRPFSYVGLDYFGPTQVRVGRSCVKRWIALFTCLTVRAVHLEVVYSLSTESCKMAIRRFIARRGSPVEIRSDNGTNFQGASRELREEIIAIEHELAETFTNSATKWIFNPPSAPHFGGAWERLVRSVKVALNSLCGDRNPDDETLWTIVLEAESIVNSRPLTAISLHSANQEALTPNHFILLSSSGVVQPPRTLSEPLKVTRTNWNLARQLVDHFWRRWIHEYLPTIANRTKWFSDAKNLAENDLVLIVDEGRRNGWIGGQVLTVIPGRDGRIRQAMIRTSKGVFKRPVTKLAVLQIEGDSNEESVVGPEVRYGAGMLRPLAALVKLW
ncbi:uncharacterized protein LOC134221929 [Armigeres subalbatus]|uniref:uncharacterized protein LOC134221929 n=1 Tax=Armigeres subalbatus TaxID=124917 RepID=UPI002ED5B6FB